MPMSIHFIFISFNISPETTTTKKKNLDQYIRKCKRIWNRRVLVLYYSLCVDCVHACFGTLESYFVPCFGFFCSLLKVRFCFIEKLKLINCMSFASISYSFLYSSDKLQLCRGRFIDCWKYAIMNQLFGYATATSLQMFVLVFFLGNLNPWLFNDETFIEYFLLFLAVFEAWCTNIWKRKMRSTLTKYLIKF